MSGSKGLNLTVEEYGPRRLVLHDIQVALAPRRWVGVEEFGPEALRVSKTSGGFSRIQLALKPNTAMAIEGVRYRLSYEGQADAENVQSHFAFHSFAYNGIRPERTRAPWYSKGAPQPSPLTKLLFKERDEIAWWITALKSKASSSALFSAAESAAIFPTAFAIYRKHGHHAVDVFQGLQGEMLKLEAGKTLELDALVFRITDSAIKTFEEYAEHTSRTMKAKPSGAPAMGWSSWYKYYPRIDQDIIAAESAAVKEKLGASDFRLLQIDDGYQMKVGDWLNDPSRFPEGMPAAVKAIEANGQTAGLWFAPFMVDRDSLLAKERISGDWLLRGDDGDPLRYSIPRHSVNYILDLSNPDVQRHVRDTVARIRDWGFRYLKADFLFLAASAAVRFDGSYSGLRAYRKGLEIMREAAGPDLKILFSGSIDLAGIGFGDAVRTGPDIAYDVLSGGTRRSLIRAQLAATASHFFAGHRWYVPNADALMLRPPLKESLAEVLIAQAAMIGGDYILSDDLRSLDASRLAKLTHPEILKMVKTRGHAVPLDYFLESGCGRVAPQPFSFSMQSAVPRIWLRTEADGRKTMFLYNVTAKRTKIAADLNALARGVLGADAVTDVFADGEFASLFHAERLKIKDGIIDFALPADCVRIFRL